MNNYHDEIISIQFISYASIPFKSDIYANRLMIDWGDGNTSTYENKKCYSIEYTYQSEGLQHIKISGDKVSYIDISRLSLTELTIAHCPELEFLDCSANELYRLQLLDCLAMEELHCNSNNLKDLIILGENKIGQINASYNELENLQLHDCGELQLLHCTNNRLKHLELPANKTLRKINISCNLMDTNDINDVFRQLPERVPADTAMIIYLDNPGTESCDKKLHTSKKWHG